MSTRWGKSAIVVVVISYLVEKKKCFSFSLLCSFLRHLALGSKKRKKKRVNADICAQVRLRSKCTYIISSSRKEKKRKKVKVEYKQELKKLMWSFWFFFFSGRLLVLKGVQLQRSTYRSTASDGVSGIWSQRENCSLFGLLSTSNERQFFSLIIVCQAGRRRKRRRYAEGDTYMYLPPRKNETHRHYVRCVIGLGRAGWLGPGQVHVPKSC